MQEVLIFTKPECEKCKLAKEIGKKLEKMPDKYAVKYLSLANPEGLMEFTYHNFQYPPAIVVGDKKYSIMKVAEKELL